MIKNSTSFLQRLKALPGLDWIVLGIGLAVFGVLVGITITSSTIWFDEAFSAYIVHFSPLEIARYTATDVHPPLYYWILQAWTAFFGTSELAFRTLSVAFGMTAISFGFLLVKRLFGRRAAWLTLLFLVLSPMLIRYSQEARMYTLAATITLAATYVLTFAVATKRKLPWVLYGILVSLGMWTHYFTALIWLAHWAWRSVIIRQQLGKKLTRASFRRAFFSREWLLAHTVAVGLFLPWIPLMLIQLTIIQASGFWISPISAITINNYLTNVLFYLDAGQANYVYGTAFVLIVGGLIWGAITLYRKLSMTDRQKYLLIIAIAFVPVVLLFIASTPPLRSSFVERYLIPSTAAFALFAGVTLALASYRHKKVIRAVLISAVIIASGFGIANVYYYGNYNKNSQTKVTTGDIVKKIQEKAAPGEPIIANSPWVFYEAVFYSTPEHPVYFIDRDTQYLYGSLDMLKYSDKHKIKDVDAFAREHPVVWYMGYVGPGEITSPNGTSWQQLQTLTIQDAINNRTDYKAVQLRTN